MRRHRFAEALGALDLKAAAVCLDVIWSDAGGDRREAAAILQPLATLSALEPLLGREALDAMRGALRRLGYTETWRLLEREERKPVDGEDGVSVAPRPSEPVGARISMARRALPRLIDRLLADPDDRVIATLLGNPRLTEREVLKLVSSPRVSPGSLEALARDPRWERRYSVALALAFNARTPIHIGLALLPRLLRQDLAEVAASERLPAFVRERAKALLDVRDAEQPRANAALEL
jgi:hypothetical protein